MTIAPEALRTLYVVAAVILSITALLYLYRIVVGPTVFDRLLGLGGVGTKAVVIVVLIGSIYGRLEMFIDIALGYALLSFVGALAAADYFSRTQRPERDA